MAYHETAAAAVLTCACHAITPPTLSFTLTHTLIRIHPRSQSLVPSFAPTCTLIRAVVCAVVRLYLRPHLGPLSCPRSPLPPPSFALTCAPVSAVVCLYLRPHPRPSFASSFALTSAVVCPHLPSRLPVPAPSPAPAFAPSYAITSAVVCPHLPSHSCRAFTLTSAPFRTLVRRWHTAVSCALALVRACWPDMCPPALVCVCVMYIVSILH